MMGRSLSRRIVGRRTESIEMIGNSGQRPLIENQSIAASAVPFAVQAGSGATPGGVPSRAVHLPPAVRPFGVLGKNQNSTRENPATGSGGRLDG